MNCGLVIQNRLCRCSSKKKQTPTLLINSCHKQHQAATTSTPLTQVTHWLLPKPSMILVVFFRCPSGALALTQHETLCMSPAAPQSPHQLLSITGCTERTASPASVSPVHPKSIPMPPCRSWISTLQSAGHWSGTSDTKAAHCCDVPWSASQELINTVTNFSFIPCMSTARCFSLGWVTMRRSESQHTLQAICPHCQQVERPERLYTQGTSLPSIWTRI